ncbi:hypothetical protein BSPLISOX_1461 [uncultured Gammaproteobacteria bacterium]|nr:hypothetical protein [uncultured Gammaproteobacteria bacterium]VVH66089.1 hypothetical protein BSPLISOX_1461 [uncultured Gammaproteobacteria bacterium]
MISLNLVLARLRLGLKNHQVGEKWISDDCSYLCKGLIVTYSCFLKATLKTKRVISKSYLWV